MKFESKPVAEHVDAPAADAGQLEQLVQTWSQRQRLTKTHDDRGNRCLIVNLGPWSSEAERQAQQNEITSLVESTGDTVMACVGQTLRKAEPRTLLGRGVYERLMDTAQDVDANMLVLDAALTPSQLRNLEEEVGMAVCDREAVILNVFLKHAKTKKAKVQVEIAHLQYLRPRIRGLGLDMDQQAGGVMRGRGPGETASELMARHLDRRIFELQKQFLKIKNTEQNQRSGRRAVKRVALVGYTNAGKTSLMNALTGAGLSARNRPFETLDATTRRLTQQGGDVLISDTVGVIRQLPERLLASFESTLAEVTQADLLALVLDASDPEVALHIETTLSLLDRLDALNIPRLFVFNKIDLQPRGLGDGVLRHLAGDVPFLTVSKHDAEAIAELKNELIQGVRSDFERRVVWVPYEQKHLLSQIYQRLEVVESEATDLGMRFALRGPSSTLNALFSEEVRDDR